MNKLPACILTFLLTWILASVVFIFIIIPLEFTPDTPDYDMEAWTSTYIHDMDCDDIALATLIALEKAGYECFGVMGDLEMDGESPEECNHAWVVAEIDGGDYYYENGEGHKLDKQHAEGYRLTKQELASAVMQDLSDAEIEEMFS